MFAFLKALAVQFIFLRALLAGLGSLGVLLPLALLLKWVGLPILGVLGILSVPLLIVLAVVGLPIALVVMVGGGVLAFLFVGLTVGVVAMIVALPIVLPLWLGAKLIGFVWRAAKPSGEAAGSAPVRPNANAAAGGAGASAS